MIEKKISLVKQNSFNKPKKSSKISWQEKQFSDFCSFFRDKAEKEIIV